MAYVAITAKLKESIDRNILAMRNQEKSAETCPILPTFNGKEDWLAPKLWGVLFDTDWYLSPSLTVKGTCATYFYLETKVDGADSKKVSMRTDIPNTAIFSRCDTQGTENWCLNIEVTEDMDPYFKVRGEYERSMQEIECRWDSVSRQIAAFVDPCKSLNEALKLWPALARYVSKEYLDKVSEKAKVAPALKALSPAMAALAAMDMETITQSTVLARMAGSAS